MTTIPPPVPADRADDKIGDGTAPFGGWGTEISLDAAPRKRRSRRTLPHTPPLSITSLTDMLTLLLVYLLKTFATSPVEVKEPSIELPRSACKPDPRASNGDEPPIDGCGPIEESTIVMITGPETRRTVDGREVIVPVAPRLVVDGNPVVELDEKTYRIPDAAKDKASGGYVVPALREALKHAKEVAEMTSQLTGKKFDGKVIIVADKQTPYRVLTDVLVTCGESGFADFRFAVIRPD